MRAPAYVGIDVAKQSFDVAVRPQDQLWNFPYTGSAIRELVARLIGLNVALIVIESTGGVEKRLLEALSATELPVTLINPRQIRDFAKASGRLAKIPNHMLPEAKADVLIVGHTHRTMVTYVDNTLIVNPGSLGQPRDPKKSTLRTYAILDTSTWEATIHGFEQARDSWG